MKRMVSILALTALPLLAAADDGAAVYKAKCAMCHGASGAGDTPMGKKLAVKNLGSPEVQKKTDAQLQGVISKGSGKMPGYDGKLTAEQVKQLVGVIRGFAAKK